MNVNVMVDPEIILCQHHVTANCFCRVCFNRNLNFDFLAARLGKSKSYYFITADRANQILLLWFSLLSLVEVVMYMWLSAVHLR